MSEEKPIKRRGGRSSINLNEKERFLEIVWPRVVSFLREYGPANYDGYTGDEKQGWLGPYVWSEDDIVKVITEFCGDEFGYLNVHNESKISKFRYENFDSKSEKPVAVDIDVTDASVCKNSAEFRRLTHTLFIEVKHIQKGMVFNDDKKKINGFERDCAKLEDQIRKGRCKYAIAILIDDGDRSGEPYVKNAESFLEDLKEQYPDVTPLYMPPPCSGGEK